MRQNEVPYQNGWIAGHTGVDLFAGTWWDLSALWCTNISGAYPPLPGAAF